MVVIIDVMSSGKNFRFISVYAPTGTGKAGVFFKYGKHSLFASFYGNIWCL